jgi:hypothetical protein
MRFRMRTAGTAVNALTIAGTGAATFSSSVTAGSQLSILGTDGGGKQLFFTGGTTKYNFIIAAQQNVNNALEITPSSAAGGSTFSTPAVVVTGTGNVGIGTTSPNVLLTIGKIGTANQLGFYDSGTAKGFIGVSAGTSDIIATDALNDMVIRPSSAGNLLFAIGSTERMRITSGGNVGIGTTAPSGPLHLSYSSAVYDGMFFTDTRATSSSGTWRIGAGTGGVGFGIYSNSLGATPFFISNSTGAATFTTSGGFPIFAKGYSETAISNIWYDNAAQVEVFNTIANSGFAGAGAGIKFLMSSSGNPQAGIYGIRITTTASALAFYTQNANFSVLERVRIDNAGNMGVGTTTINERLDVEGNQVLRNSGTYSTSLTRDIIYRSSTASYGIQPIANIQFATVGDAQSEIRFITRSSPADYAQRMVIDKFGNLGVGTTSPTSKLHVVGLPTSSSGLTAGAIWIDGTTLKIVT